MKKISFGFIAIVLISLFISACKKNDDLSPQGYTPETGYTHGLFVVNEGAYLKNNGSISYYDPITNSTTNDIFAIQNKSVLGDVVQSFGIADSVGYIVVNNSLKVEAINLKTFKRIETISGFTYPRYFIKAENKKGYVTDGNMAGKVSVIDLVSNKITKSIAVGNGPETMVKVGDMVYVANSGGFDIDSTVSVIDTKNDAVSSTFKTKAHRPVGMVVDLNKNIWILCQGLIDWLSYPAKGTTDSKLVKYNTETGNIDMTLKIGVLADSFFPNRIAISPSGKFVYYIEFDGVYIFDINSTSINSKPYIAGNFNGLQIDPNNGNIYLFEAPNFTTNGKMSVCKSDGTVIYSGITVGIGPNGGVFN